MKLQSKEVKLKAQDEELKKNISKKYDDIKQEIFKESD